MDPFMISTVVVRLTAASLTTAKLLHDIRNKYKDAPMTITTICCETAVITASLSHVQAIICQKQNFVQLLDSRPELAHTIDASLTGCMVIFSCLDEELRKITENYSRTNLLSKRGKAKTVWNLERLRELLDAIRGQQTALTLLIQLVQLDSLGEIKQLLTQNQKTLAKSIITTHSLRQMYANVRFPASIYSAGDRQGIYSSVPSISGASVTEFDFDDMIVDSKVYRRVLAKFKEKAAMKYDEVLQGDLIDFSNDDAKSEATIRLHSTNDVLQVLDNLSAETPVLAETATRSTTNPVRHSNGLGGGTKFSVESVYDFFERTRDDENHVSEEIARLAHDDLHCLDKLSTNVPDIAAEPTVLTIQPKNHSSHGLESAKPSAESIPVYDSFTTPRPLIRDITHPDLVDKTNLDTAMSKFHSIHGSKRANHLAEPTLPNKSFATSKGTIDSENYGRTEIVGWVQIRPELSESLLISACISRYCFAEDKYWFSVDAEFVDGRTWELQRYYEDFYDFQLSLWAKFPKEAGAAGHARILPHMPGPVERVTDKIAESRQHNLDVYIKLLLELPPRISKCTLVRHFFTPQDGDYML